MSRKFYMRNYMKEYRKSHLLRNLAIQSNKRNKGKGRITAQDLFSIAHSQKLICPLTGEKLTAENISVDHILPCSKGGRNTPSNIRLTTRDINWFRRTMTDGELVVLCQRVVNHMVK